ncbi:threonine/serine exporter family protein [Massilibacteroides sp.]|uniref:threonine/serine ThrE exporter family protein n=1 Tax=Massilibacteroides sp. TaxID=2034766 RepID=UPI002632337A|nr:threonine/serine exporter family protein [Massilibacteroides sp.]MDD4514180.1 threonine/serine exporter family protein [Massilibacteroides sp.]
MISKIHNTGEGVNELTAKEVCIFLSDYAARLLGCGATCIRIEKNVRRMSKAFSMDVEMTIMPSHIHLSVWDKAHTESFTNIKRIHKGGISFNINTLLSKLSWEVADGKVNFQDALRLFKKITDTPPSNQRLVLFLASLANAAFCRLFGGDPIAMLIVFIATLVGYRVKQIMLEDGADVRFVFLCAAFFSSVIAASGHLFGLGETPEIALGASVLYLIPGIPYINSVSDMLDGHYICSFSRFMDAAILTACLSIGMCGGLLLMNLGLF